MKHCEVEGCEREAVSRNYCQSHYARFIKYGDATIGGPIRSKSSRKGECAIEGCTKQIYAKKMCQKHHRRWLRHNNPTHRSYKVNKGLICKDKLCKHEARSKGYCTKHYAKFYRQQKKHNIEQKKVSTI